MPESQSLQGFQPIFSHFRSAQTLKRLWQNGFGDFFLPPLFNQRLEWYIDDRFAQLHLKN